MGISEREFRIKRDKTDGLSIAGHFVEQFGGKTVLTLERGLEQPEHPGIPAGRWELKLRREGEKWQEFMFHPRPGSMLLDLSDLLQDGLPLVQVDGRQFILIHPFNRVGESLGCIAPGLKRIGPQESGSGHWEITRSREAMRLIYPDIKEAIQAGRTWLVVG